MATSDTIAATHDHETTRIRQSPPVTLKFDASSSPMSSLSSMPSPESTRQKTTTQAKTPNFITRDQALAQQHRVIQGPSLFSTNNGQREPRPAPIPRDAVIVRSDLNADAREFCEKLRLESPKICLKVFAPFDIRTFFDEYDFERLGGEFLYETLILLWKENGKRVVDFCQNWALKNEEAFHHWFDGKCDVETLFAKADQEEYGYDFLDKALMCMKECYEAAGEQRVTESVGGNAYQHNHYVLTQMEQHEGSAFQVQNTNVNNAYVANQNHANARYASSYADQHAGYQNGRLITTYFVSKMLINCRSRATAISAWQQQEVAQEERVEEPRSSKRGFRRVFSPSTTWSIWAGFHPTHGQSSCCKSRHDATLYVAPSIHARPSTASYRWCSWRPTHVSSSSSERCSAWVRTTTWVLSDSTTTSRARSYLLS